MGLGNVFLNTWDDYKNNFWANIKILLVYFVLPLIVLYLVVGGMVYATGLYADFNSLIQKSANIQAKVLSGDAESGLAFQNELGMQFAGLLGRVILVGLVGLVLFIVLMFMNFKGYLSIYGGALKRKVYSFKEAVKDTKPYYWKSIGLYFILALIMLPIIFVGMLIGAITFGVGFILAFAVFVWLFICWSFSAYILVDKNKGVFQSMSDSWKFVKGRWWKIFGYGVVISLIDVVICLVFGVLQGVVSYLIFPNNILFNPTYLSINSTEQLSSIGNNFVNSFIEYYVVQLVFSIVLFLFLIPYLLLFVKNMYQEFKKEKKV